MKTKKIKNESKITAEIGNDVRDFEALLNDVKSLKEVDFSNTQWRWGSNSNGHYVSYSPKDRNLPKIEYILPEFIQEMIRIEYAKGYLRFREELQNLIGCHHD